MPGLVAENAGPKAALVSAVPSSIQVKTYAYSAWAGFLLAVDVSAVAATGS
jgi:hypothetical protein